MKKLLGVIFLFLGQQLFSAENSKDDQSSYDYIVYKRSEYQRQFNEVEVAVSKIDGKIAATKINFDTINQLIQKQTIEIQQTQAYVSLDQANDIVACLQKEKNKNEFSKLRLERLQDNLRRIQQQIDYVREKRLSMDVPYILSFYPYNVYYSNVHFDCVGYQCDQLDSYKKNYVRYKNSLHQLSQNRHKKMTELESVRAFMNEINKWSDALLTKEREQMALMKEQEKNIQDKKNDTAKTIQLLQAMNFKQQAEKEQNLHEQQQQKTEKIAKLTEFFNARVKSSVIAAEVDFIFEQACKQIDNNEVIRLDNEQRLLDEAIALKKVSLTDVASLAAAQNILLCKKNKAELPQLVSQERQDKQPEEQEFIPVVKKGSKNKKKSAQIKQASVVSKKNSDEEFLDELIAQNKAAALLEKPVVDNKEIMKLLYQYCRIIKPSQTINTKKMLADLLHFVEVAEPVQNYLKDKNNVVYTSIDADLSKISKEFSDEWRESISGYTWNEVLDLKIEIENKVAELSELTENLQKLMKSSVGNKKKLVSECKKMIIEAERAQTEFNQIDEVYDMFRIVAVLDTIEDVQ